MATRLFLFLIATATSAHAVPSGWSTPFFFLTNNNATRSSVAVDSAGGVHVAFSSFTSSGSGYPVYYGYCPSSCTSASRFTVISIGDVGNVGGYVSLGVDGNGHPRMIFFNESYVPNGFSGGTFEYAECNASCTSGGNWTVLPVTTTNVSPTSNRYFALDAQGRPRFLYVDNSANHTGLFYATCDSGCSSVNNWFEGLIDSSSSSVVWSLAFDSVGRPRAALGFSNSLGFAQCDTNCYDAASWSAASPFTPAGGGGSPAVLRLDSSDRPRLAFYSSADTKLYYAFCNAACTTVSNWTRIDPGFPTYTGQRLDMALNAQNRPLLAMLSGTYGGDTLSYATCTANCESATGTWQLQTVETGSDIDQSNPIAPPQGCSLSAWYSGDFPAIAVDSSGSVKISYDAYHYHGGFGGTCTAAEDIRLTRYTQLSTATRGDANGDSAVTVADVFYVINNLFAGGPPPASTCAGDANGDGNITVADVFYLINNLFAGGPAPAGC